MDLAARVAPLTLARERVLPVDPVLGCLLPERGLVRGRVVGCGGDAAMSLALALAARSSAAGSWLAVVGPVPAGGAPGTVGVEAAAELGVAVERLVAVDADPRQPREWAERVAAAADGVELILTRPPVGADRVMRLVRQRIQARGAVLLAVGANTGADLVVEARTMTWEGIGAGVGRLCRRRVALQVTGRRVPRPVHGECWLPGASGAVEPIVAAADLVDLDATAVIPLAVAAASIPAVDGLADDLVEGVELSRTG